MNEEQQEEWRPIPGYEGRYEASSYGRLRSVSRTVRGRGNGRTERTGRILRTGINPTGYAVISIRSADGVTAQKTVHRLVARAFLSVPSDMQINHLDGHKLNNHISNLEVCTAAQNCQHRNHVLGLNRGAKNPGARLTEETAARGIALIRSGMTQHAVAKILGVSRSTISHAYYGITWKHLSSPGQPPCVSL